MQDQVGLILFLSLIYFKNLQMDHLKCQYWT